MDQLDYLILSELLKDPQISFLAISKKLGVSSFTVKSRYTKMKAEKVIMNCVVNIDLSKLGYQGKAILLITNAPHAPKSATLEALKKIRNVFVASEIIGPFDILVIAPVTDLNSVRSLVNEIKRLPSVQRVHISCINDTMFPVSSTFGKVLSERSHDLGTAKSLNIEK